MYLKNIKIYKKAKHTQNYLRGEKNKVTYLNNNHVYVSLLYSIDNLLYITIYFTLYIK